MFGKKFYRGLKGRLNRGVRNLPTIMAQRGQARSSRIHREELRKAKLEEASVGEGAVKDKMIQCHRVFRSVMCSLAVLRLWRLGVKRRTFKGELHNCTGNNCIAAITVQAVTMQAATA